jgi:hypothetical protein
MHNPSILVFSIRNPFQLLKCYFKKKPLYHASDWIDIWHEDPCSDGSDDSCGYSYYKLKKDDSAWCKKESKYDYNSIFGIYQKKVDSFELIYHVWNSIKWSRFKRRKITHKELLNIIDLSYNVYDNLRDVVNQINDTVFNRKFAELRARQRLGIRSEWDYLSTEDYDYTSEESKLIYKGEEAMASLYYLVYRNYMTFHRPWYKHPKFHFRHWRIRVVPLSLFKRWVFGRCCKCDKRFK